MNHNKICLGGERVIYLRSNTFVSLWVSGVRVLFEKG